MSDKRKSNNLFISFGLVSRLSHSIPWLRRKRNISWSLNQNLSRSRWQKQIILERLRLWIEIELSSPSAIPKSKIISEKLKEWNWDSALINSHWAPRLDFIDSTSCFFVYWMYCFRPPRIPWISKIFFPNLEIQESISICIQSSEDVITKVKSRYSGRKELRELSKKMK